MTEYPVQLSKVQAPPLRDETLARDRLLDWLSLKIHRRVVLLVAEAGYGKTTLLADFTRRTRLRVLWFRLDRGDRDWVGFIAHLVAALRLHVPEFGPSTRALLSETATTAPSLEAVLDSFLRELAGASVEPTAFVFDDFHLVDDSADVRQIIRELLARGPERTSFVFATRSEPPIRLARLRALGEVAELATDDLRFDAIETERLFRETYEMRLEPSVLTELSRRTEGWAASLQLVRAALHDRNPGEVRSFINSLSGAEGHLYEYLAEEVIGELPDDLQQFLMRTSVLETVDLKLGPVAADISVDEASRLIDAGESHGLFGRGAPRVRHVVRAHPLVRDFLLDRLVRTIGIAGKSNIHLRTAQAAEAVDWRLAARHYLDAHQDAEAERVLAAALETILAMGAYQAAQELAGQLAGGSLPGVEGLVLRSRLAFQRADGPVGLQLAEEARETDPESAAALFNLVSARTLAGDVAGAIEANRLLGQATQSAFADIGRAYERTVAASLNGSVDAAEAELQLLADGLRRESQAHFLGVTLLNLALVRISKGSANSALGVAEEAVDILTATSSNIELIAARLARVQALALLGRLDDARQEIDTATRAATSGQAIELAGEIGWAEALFGEVGRARSMVEIVTAGVAADSDPGEQAIHARALVRIGSGDLAGAAADVGQLRFGQPTTALAFEARRYLLLGLVQLMQGRPEASASIRKGTEIAQAQGAYLWSFYGRTLEALANATADPSAAVLAAAEHQPVVLSMLSDVATTRLADLDSQAADAIAIEANERPWRWRVPVRRALTIGDVSERLLAAHLLEQIGEDSDIATLRDFGRRLPARRGARLGYALARRLATHVRIEDLGRVRIVKGDTSTEGPEVRRKVLALLCLLLTRPRFVLTRDEVLDSLWPDHDPASALNSLNQTVYFLRRVFEPNYSEDLSPGYVGQDGETIWLDTDLVDCSSRRCLEIIRSMPGEPTAEGALKLATEYRGRFALDFAYEEWAVPFRDALHAAYLRVMEHAIRLDIAAGHLARGTFLAERAAEVDPDSEEIQLSLARLYRHSGAHAAAAEQYGHYARVMKDLGVEPLALDDL
jgi:DNA-binding SARP family transcriptional activator